MDKPCLLGRVNNFIYILINTIFVAAIVAKVKRFFYWIGFLHSNFLMPSINRLGANQMGPF